MRTYDEEGSVASASPSSTRHTELGATVQRVAATRDTRALDVSGALALQRVAGNATVSSLVEDDVSPVLDVVDSGGGQPLDSSTRQTMEQALGADFGDVRIHTDSDASASAQSVRAKAYTVGEDVAFQAGEYSPSTENGKRTLAHELTHVVQQRSGPVDGAPSGGGIAVSEPSDRFEQEAEASADRVLSGESDTRAETGPASAGDGAAGAHASVQRDVEDELADDEE